MFYPINVYKEDGEYIAALSHPNERFQFACSGATRLEVLEVARDMLAATLASALRDGDIIPPPEECDSGNVKLILPPSLSAKVAIYQEMRQQGKRKADIARALGVNQKQIDRVLNPAHNSALIQLQAAAQALGKTLDVRLA